MPRRQDLKRICVIGAGPIQIGQACEFDYSGTQACKALREEGIEIILINSNPATIMTSTDIADRTYIEPLTPEDLERILEIERPDAILPTLGGQTALTLALELHDRGVLEKLGIELLGASAESIRLAEDRELFKARMVEIGLDVAISGHAKSLEEARAISLETGFPCVLRPSFTLGGVGGGIVETPEQFDAMVEWALDMSPVSEVLIEESLLGLKEFEMEVMRDQYDRAVIVCAIENLDPMGVHTGDSITIAPAQTLTDREYQRMRNASLATIRAVGVATGGSNIQFALDPLTNRMIVIEMNPRVSRSSALASKATGFPIAKIAALLAIGYGLDEIDNAITGKTPACFEPTLDYIVTKIPRFAFEKFPDATTTLTTQMKSVGEVMGIGRTFKESLLKALRGLENGQTDLLAPPHIASLSKEELLEKIQSFEVDRLWYVAQALRLGVSVKHINALTSINTWFIEQIAQIVLATEELPSDITDLDALDWRQLKRLGLSDRTIAHCCNATESAARAARQNAGITPVYRRVDTCAAEFESSTPYLYSTYADACEADPTDTPCVIILGSGPNRIGQGIEFDTSCVKAVMALKARGIEAIMLNCNPETVSTDHDMSDRLYFEPVDLEAVLNVIDKEKPLGVIVQLGGQTPLRLTHGLNEAGVTILGTTEDVIDTCEDRERFKQFAISNDLKLPPQAIAHTPEHVRKEVASLGYPVLSRPSRVLGGQSMAILRNDNDLEVMLDRFFSSSGDAYDPEALPLLLDAYLDGAVEVDVDAVSDGTNVLIGGLMEQIEPAGVHSGDSACLLPPATLPQEITEQLESLTERIAKALEIKGLINIQFAIQDNEIYVLEVNPRASRTIPFVEKATGVCLTSLATGVFLGEPLPKEVQKGGHGWACKEVVLPFSRFPGAQPTLSPQMRSTGEVLAYGDSPQQAFWRAQVAVGNAPEMSTEPLLLDAAPESLAELRTLRDTLAKYEIMAPAHCIDACKQALELPITLWTPELNQSPRLVALIAPVGSRTQASTNTLFRHVLAEKWPYVSTIQALSWMLNTMDQNLEVHMTPIQERLAK